MDQLPIAVVIPILNEELTINELLFKLANQSALPSEIIFCDAGSEDGTINAIKQWSEANDLKNITLKIVIKPGANPGAGRNAGIKMADSPWIAFTDAGISPHVDWLEQLWTSATNLGREAIFGTCEFHASGNLQRAVCALSYGVNAKHAVVPASLFSRKVFELAGFFREDLRCAEDQLWMRSVDKHFPRINCKKALVTYSHFPNDLNSIAKKWYSYQLHTVRAGTKKLQQFLYLIAPFLIFTLWFMSLSIAILSFAIYLIFRGVIDPWRKSGYQKWWKGENSAFFLAILIVVVMDVSKFLATIVASNPFVSRQP